MDDIVGALREEFESRIPRPEWDHMVRELGFGEDVVVHRTEDPIERHLRLAELIRSYLAVRDHLRERFANRLKTPDDWTALMTEIELGVLLQARDGKRPEAVLAEAERAAEDHYRLADLQREVEHGA